jgi:hypothetical protein
MTTPPNLLLFGAATPSGAAFAELAAARLSSWPLIAAGRRRPELAAAAHLPCDLERPDTVQPPDGSAIWVSFAPIWHLAPFLETLRRQRPGTLAGLQGLVACSSSSVVTKRFAANRHDRELVARLRGAENQLEATCAALGVPCRVLAPTLIYGSAAGYGDRNLSQLIGLMRRLPLLPVPSPGGLRQPIHCRQLAAVALEQALALTLAPTSEPAGSGLQPYVHLLVGGDDSLSYGAMLQRLQQALPAEDRGRRCRLLPVPAPMLLGLAVPLLLLSPRRFEAVQRMQADLAGFCPAHRLLGADAEPFPLQPLAR